jgi:hypothetical protein
VENPKVLFLDPLLNLNILETFSLTNHLFDPCSLAGQGHAHLRDGCFVHQIGFHILVVVIWQETVSFVQFREEGDDVMGFCTIP